MKFTVHQSSRQGPKPHNQDRLAYSYSKDSVLLVIADGMGGYRHGEVAAQLAVKSLTEAFQAQAKPRLANPVEFLTTQILDTHRAIEALALNDEMLESPRTTIVAAVLQGQDMFCAHVGDSRLYHFRAGELLFKTEDHSLVQRLFRKGLLRRVDMFTHPERHKIYNCLGGEREPKIDIAHSKNLEEGDIILLCSDGLWTLVDDNTISKTLMEGMVSETVPKLLGMAESRASLSGDNMSAIGLQWGDSHLSPLAVSTVTMPIDFATTIMSSDNQPTTIPNHNEATESDLSDEAIEQAIAEIQSALKKTKSN